MRVVYGPRAVADLIDIADYLKARSPDGARAVERRILRSIALLAEFPGADARFSKGLRCASYHWADIPI